VSEHSTTRVMVGIQIMPLWLLVYVSLAEILVYFLSFSVYLQLSDVNNCNRCDMLLHRDSCYQLQA
jgi:hypothetical protein